MLGQLTVFWNSVLYVVSALVCGLLFFWGNALEKNGSWFLWAMGMTVKIISVFFAIIALIALVALFTKAFWGAAISFVILVVVFWFLSR